MTYLLGGGGRDQVLLPVNWAAAQPQLHGLLSPLWDHAALFEQAGTGGGAYWARRGRGGGIDGGACCAAITVRTRGDLDEKRLHGGGGRA